jgi:hypothetical protein
MGKAYNRKHNIMTIEYAPDSTIIYRSKYCPLNSNVTGYGNKIPCPYYAFLPDSKIKRRVYAICYSNTASHYVLVNGKRVFFHDYQFDNLLKEEI